MTTLEYLYRCTIPAAHALLPERMLSPHASAMLLAIALQESGAVHRKQVQGPARSFWQFETGGVRGVRNHHATKDHLQGAIETLCYEPTITNKALQVVITDNDVLAAVCARLLLWTLPAPLPESNDPDGGWNQYLDAWRPGKPHLETWRSNFDQAWLMVNQPLSE